MAELDVNKVMIMVNYRFGMCNVTEFQLNQDEEGLVEHIVQMILSASTDDTSSSSDQDTISRVEAANGNYLKRKIKKLPSNKTTNAEIDNCLPSSSKSHEKFSRGKTECISPLHSSSTESFSSFDDDDETELEEDSTKMPFDKKKEIRQLIENCEHLLNICPYCKHRPASGYIDYVTEHIETCDRKTNVNLPPLRISKVEKFLSFPKFATEINSDKEDDEKILMTYREEKGGLLATCPHCNGRLKSGDWIKTRTHMITCPEKKKRILEPTSISSLEHFVTFPIIAESKEAFYKNEEERISMFIKKYHINGLYVCSYCNKRTAYGRISDSKKHMKVCPNRNDRKLEPRKVNNLKRFVRIPQITKSSPRF